MDVGLTLLLIIQVIVIVYLGLTPFTFSVQNEVQASSNTPGIAFDAVGMGTSEGEIIGGEHFPDETLSLHFMIEPADEPRTALGAILSINAAAGVTPLIIAQWKNWLVVRVRDPEHRSLGYWEIDTAGFPQDQRHFVTITSSPEGGTAIYVDGQPTGDTRRHSIVRLDRGFDGKLLLGCLSNGAAGWRGTLSGLVMTTTQLTPGQVAQHHTQVSTAGFGSLRDIDGLFALYDFEDLTHESGELSYSLADAAATSALGRIQFPEIFSPLRPAVFAIPELRDMKADWFLKDLLLNIAGFVPLGFFAALILIRNRRSRGYWITLQVAALGALLSVGIESVQIALPMRSSSMSDLTLNMIGSALGAITALAFRYSRIGDPAA